MRMYGRLATACGYTYSEIEETPFPFVFELYEYWHLEPPIHDLGRWFTEYKPKTVIMEPTKADSAFLSHVGRAPTKTFDNLPLHVQAWLSKTKETVQ